MKTAHKTLAAIFALLAIALFAACSSDSDDDSISASDLAGTTWTASYGGQTVATLKFASDGTVTMIDDEGDEITGESYSVSGSTVTIYDDDGVSVQQLTYSSGQLLYPMYDDDGELQFLTFTKS